MNKARIEAFTDAVIAIVLTVLILEMRVPNVPSMRAVLGEWRLAFSYLMTFMLVMSSWYNQHNLFANAKHVNLPTYIAICIWLFIISFLPLATSFVGRFPNYRGAELLYVTVNLLWSIAFDFLVQMFHHDNPHVAALQVYIKRRIGTRTFIIHYIWYLLVIPLIVVVPELGILTPMAILTIQGIVTFSQYLHRRRAA